MSVENQGQPTAEPNVPPLPDTVLCNPEFDVMVKGKIAVTLLSRWPVDLPTCPLSFEQQQELAGHILEAVRGIEKARAWLGNDYVLSMAREFRMAAEEPPTTSGSSTS